MTDPDFFDQYHSWYYDSRVWLTTTFLGVPCQKSVSDLWNYQEILHIQKPSLVIETGTARGGSALYFSSILALMSRPFRVVSVDISHEEVAVRVKNDPHIELITGKLTDPQIRSRIIELRKLFPGPAFAILDSDHTRQNVLAEMEALQSILVCGDYLIVEDGNINGHPVLPAWGEGPYEAIAEYVQKHPDDYSEDLPREKKFGFTFAPRGFLVRN